MNASRPILFKGPMVRALIDGHKTQTRRIVKPQPRSHERGMLLWRLNSYAEVGHTDGMVPQTFIEACPYGLAGDLLWVRESILMRPSRSARDMREGADTWPRAIYQADGLWFGGRYPESDKPAYKSEVEREWCKAHGWKAAPSIHMPRWASRLTLDLTDVRVERVQDISYADIIAEGWPGPHAGMTDEVNRDAARDWWSDVWGDINGPESWKSNPWTWALSFRVHSANAAEHGGTKL